MSHAESKRYPEGSAAQLRSGSVALQATSRGSLRACKNALHLPPSGISLPATSATPEGAGCHWGSQDRLHGQALSNFGRPTQGLCIFDRTDPERHRQPCGFAAAATRAKTWLKSRRMAIRWPFGWNIDLIACWPKNSLKRTNCWCPNGAGWRIVPMLIARRC